MEISKPISQILLMKKALILALLLSTSTIVYATPIKVNVFYKGKLAEDIIVVWFTINNLSKQNYLVNIYLKYIKQGHTIINATIDKTYIFAVKILNNSLSNASPVILINSSEVKLEISREVERKIYGIKSYDLIFYTLNIILKQLTEQYITKGPRIIKIGSHEKGFLASIDELEPGKVYLTTITVEFAEYHELHEKHYSPLRTMWQAIIPLTLAILAAVIVILLKKKILSKFPLQLLK